MAGVPDAWDDDYEAVANKPTCKGSEKNSMPARTSRAERKAQHAEANKALWNSAENPQTFHFIDSRNEVPLKSEFKPALKVLSRKPQPQVSAPQQNTSGTGLESSLQNVALQEDDDPDSEEEARREQERTLGERQARAKRERDEKAKRYIEVRQRLFGSPNTTQESTPKAMPNGKGKGVKNHKRGGASGGSGSHQASSTDHSPARPASQNSKQLYDPNYSIKSNSAFIQRREGTASSSRAESPADSQHIRGPRGPDGSGRGGFGFAPRGNKTNVG